MRACYWCWLFSIGHSGSVAPETHNHSINKELLQGKDGVRPNIYQVWDSMMALHLLVNGGSSSTKECGQYLSGKPTWLRDQIAATCLEKYLNKRLSMHLCAYYQYLSDEVYSIGGTVASTKNPVITLGFSFLHPKSVRNLIK